MTKEKQLEEIEKLWNGRNPCHQLDDETGKDMFWETVLCVFNDLNKALNITPVVESTDYQGTACRECGTELSGSELSSNTCLSCGCSPAIKIK